MFVYWRTSNAGSAQTIRHYAEAAQQLGHEVVIYAPPDPTGRFPCTLGIGSADAVIFVLEYNLFLHPGGEKKSEPLKAGLMGIGEVNIMRLLSKVPRERRIIIDNDGMYSEPIGVDGDFTHADERASRERIALCDSLTDKIYQPSYHPTRPNVRTFLFHGYRSEWEIPLDFRNKPFGMFYVGSNWFRWRGMQRVLQAIEPIRQKVGRIGVVGHDWAAIPPWVPSPLREQAYFTDPDYLRRLDVEIMPAVPVDQVISTMSQGVFNPVLVRPTFNRLRMLNPRLFETPAANTIPLFNLDREFVCELYGDIAGSLVLDGQPTELIQDVLQCPEHYAPIVLEMRRHLAEKHSFTVRARELVEIARSE